MKAFIIVAGMDALCAIGAIPCGGGGGGPGGNGAPPPTPGPPIRAPGPGGPLRGIPVWSQAVSFARDFFKHQHADWCPGVDFRRSAHTSTLYTSREWGRAIERGRKRERRE